MAISNKKQGSGPVFVLYAVGESKVLRPGVDYDMMPGGYSAIMRRRVWGPVKYMQVIPGLKPVPTTDHGGGST